MVRIDISGWRYAPWRGKFYPSSIVQRGELAFASREFSTVEINGSFYSLQRPESWLAWHDQTPDNFLFAVKGPRFITHTLRLRNVEMPLANFFASGVLALRAKLGPMLWQFPPTLRYDPVQLEAFLTLLPKSTGQAAKLASKYDVHLKGPPYLDPGPARRLRHAIEVRHQSFVEPSFIALLRKYNIGFVIADTAGKYPRFFDLTASFVYVRLHGDKNALHQRLREESSSQVGSTHQRLAYWCRGPKRPAH
jgi:uncharacterized protein YecE (DUF72 family)